MGSHRLGRKAAQYRFRWAGIPEALKGRGIKRPKVGFYALRRTFETIGGESRDQVAVDHIMGHERDDMAAVYRERIFDERLQAVVDVVRAWLWPDGV